jgi:hypothetical protein
MGKPEKAHREDLGIDGTKESKWMGVKWIHLPQERDQQWAFANTVMTNDHSVSTQCGNFLNS